jgi:hypothetical protein
MIRTHFTLFFQITALFALAIRTATRIILMAVCDSITLLYSDHGLEAGWMLDRLGHPNGTVFPI